MSSNLSLVQRFLYWFYTRMLFVVCMILIGGVVFYVCMQQAEGTGQRIAGIALLLLIGVVGPYAQFLILRHARFIEAVDRLGLLEELNQLEDDSSTFSPWQSSLECLHALTWGENAFTQDEKESMSEVYCILANRYWASVARHNEHRACLLYALKRQWIAHAEKFVSKAIEWGPPRPYPAAFPSHMERVHFR